MKDKYESVEINGGFENEDESDILTAEEMKVLENAELVDELQRLKNTLCSQGEKLYEVVSQIYIDDSTNIEKTFFFKKPQVASYDRYVTTASQSPTRALKAFVLDNVVKEQRESLEEMLEEYPAFTMSVGEKLMAILGLAKSTDVKKL